MSRDPAPLFLSAFAGHTIVGLNPDELDRIHAHRGAVSVWSILAEALELYREQRRQAFLEVGVGADDPEEHRRYPPRDEILLVLRGHIFGYEVDPDLFDELHRYTIDPAAQAALSWGQIIREAVRALGEHLDELAAPPAHGSAPRTWPLYTPPAVVDPIPREEARAICRGWR